MVVRLRSSNILHIDAIKMDIRQVSGVRIFETLTAMLRRFQLLVYPTIYDNTLKLLIIMNDLIRCMLCCHLSYKCGRKEYIY